MRHQSLLHLAWFLPYAFMIAFFYCAIIRRVEVVYFSDGVVGFFAPFLRPFTQARFVLTIYGLELTYKYAAARSLMGLGARVCDRVITISQVTRELALSAGVNSKLVAVVYVGVEPLTLKADRLNDLRRHFEAEHGLRFGSDRVLLNFGRMVARKGLVAFVKHGLPLLEADIRLIVSGQGPEQRRLEQICEERGLQNRIILLGKASDQTVAMLRESADLFIMPNVTTSNDVEGFGMTHLESMYSGLPVVAFAVDALVESTGKGGYLIPANDYQAFVDRIHLYFGLSHVQVERKRTEARNYVRQEYSWEQTTTQYLDLFEREN